MAENKLYPVVEAEEAPAAPLSQATAGAVPLGIRDSSPSGTQLQEGGGKEGVEEYEDMGPGETPVVQVPMGEEMQNQDGNKLTPVVSGSQLVETAQGHNDGTNAAQFSGDTKSSRYFYYGAPLYEETGVWIPVSVPPMSEHDHEEWAKGFCSNGAYFPEEDIGWGQLAEEDKEMTLWDVVAEMLIVARGKITSLTSGEFQSCRMSWISTQFLDQTWKEMAHTLTEVSFSNTMEILDTEPPRWLADSAASACMLCGVKFHPIMCSRHHCRFCGGIFCSQCSKGKSLLPPKFRICESQRVCDVCCVRLESVQPYLIDKISPASQLPTHDLTDLSTLRSWINFPWGQSMEYEIYKATNTLRGYAKVGSLRPEKSIPEAILRQAKGLAILTVVKVGLMVTYNIGTGLVIARREDGSWSPPSAIFSFGAGWGAQGGGELTDFIIVLRNKEAIKTFSGNAHFSVGAGISAAAGIFGRAANADLRTGDGGCAACYTYSCSKGYFLNPRFMYDAEAHVDGEVLQGTLKVIGRLSRTPDERLQAEVEMNNYRMRTGTYSDSQLLYAVGRVSPGAFVGCSLEGSIVTTRTSENARFYGTSIDASDIVLGSLPRPPAAAILYRALSDLFQKLENSSSGSVIISSVGNAS